MGPDRAGKFEAHCFDEINDSLLTAHVLAARIAILAAEGADRMDIFRDVFDELREVSATMKAYSEDVQYYYSGNAFVPVFDHEEDASQTAFVRLEKGRGRFECFAIRDAVDMSFISKDPEEAATDEDDYHGLALLDPDEPAGIDVDIELLEPKLGPRLYAQFVTMRITGDEDSQLCGPAVCSRDTVLYHIIDMESLKIDYIETIDADETVELNKVTSELLAEAAKMRHLKRDTAFRQSSTDYQVSVIEQELGVINKKLGLERTVFFASPDYLYVCMTDEGERLLAKAEIESRGMHLQVTPDGVDSLELYNLMSGQGICCDSHMVDPAAGLCLVGHVDEATAEIIGLPSTIVWIPLANMQPEDIVAAPRAVLF